MPRTFFIGGNFKMNPISNELVDVLNAGDLDPNVEVVVAPPALYLIPLSDKLRKDIKVSAQNCYLKTSGAFTGEISPTQLVGAQIPFVILGHSERRTLFGETSEIVATKTRAALDAGLSIILCIGETLQEREGGKTVAVCHEQLDSVKKLVNTEKDWKKVVIAYEPVWAIGTGKVATTDQAQETHAELRKYLSEKLSPEIAESTRILYGGSVNGSNCKELAKQPDIDGFLVGGASLKPEFIDIINSKRA